MIKINLCPVDELRSPYWLVPDVAMVLTVALAAYLGVQYYLGGIQDEIDVANEHVASLQTSTRQLEPEVERFKGLQANIELLNKKLSALKSITVSKISKYKPVIVLEHLQNLKPEGAWFQSLRYGVTTPEQLEIQGGAFDNILTAELITALRATESQEPDDGDLRTQVYFSGLILEQSTLVRTGTGFPDLRNYAEFSLRGQVLERSGGRAAGDPPPPSSLGSRPLTLKDGPARDKARF